jgi:hypothetical protein
MCSIQRPALLRKRPATLQRTRLSLRALVACFEKRNIGGSHTRRPVTALALNIANRIRSFLPEDDAVAAGSITNKSSTDRFQGDAT